MWSPTCPAGPELSTLASYQNHGEVRDRRRKTRCIIAQLSDSTRTPEDEWAEPPADDFCGAAGALLMPATGRDSPAAAWYGDAEAETEPALIE